MTKPKYVATVENPSVVDMSVAYVPTNPEIPPTMSPKIPGAMNDNATKRTIAPTTNAGMVIVQGTSFSAAKRTQKTRLMTTIRSVPRYTDTRSPLIA